MNSYSPVCSLTWACAPSPTCVPVKSPTSSLGRWWYRQRPVATPAGPHPWDLESYGIDPDKFSVARAVHASSAIPYVFEPVRVGGATWVDGGLLSNFPVELFDRPDAQPRWPTFGIRLSARPGIPPPTR